MIKIKKSMRELIIEYRQFPKGAHDDILDTIEMGVRMSMREDRSLPMSMAVD